jgi:RNA polymerase sigma factor (sigma-70 family)
MIPANPAPRGVGPLLRTVTASEGSPGIEELSGVNARDASETAAESRCDASTPARSIQSDDQLVTLVRRGQQGAFDALAARYQSRLLSFCLQMLKSKEDAEDALQDVFAAAYNAILADEREIQVRPWLYRIARNRCLNQLRRTATVGVDTMDDHTAENGLTLVEKVVSRQEFRELVSDVQALPDTQRTALLLREIDGFTYAHIAVAMDTTVPGVKSLLVRARSRLLDSAAVRDETLRAGRRERTLTRTRGRSRPRRGSRSVNYPTAQAAASVARGAAA